MPDTARHFILGGTDGAATGAASSSGFSYWLNEFAEENSNAAYPYIAVGRDGTLAELADADAVLTPEWAVGAPLDAWPDLSDEANFAIWIAPETNIQHGSPSVSATGASPVASALAVIDAVQKAHPGTPVRIFENWADPSAFLLDGTLSDAARDVYFDYVAGAYHNWFDTFVADLQAARPDVDITLVPAASTLADLATSPAFGDLAETLMPKNPDDGAMARGLLTGAVAYTDSFESALPADTPLVEKSTPELTEIYPDLAEAVSVAILGDAGTVPDAPSLTITGTAENDSATLTTAVSSVDLGDGFDTLLIETARSDSKILFADDGSVSVLLPGDSSPAEVNNVERLVFEDGTLAFDDEGIAGQAYRLYQTAFDRTPDTEGLSFWIKELDASKVDLFEAAELFMQSEEFATAYGEQDAVTDVLFLTLLYVNTLDRPPDDDGFIFWRGEQDNGITRAEMMVYFSESAENKAQVAPAIDDGIWFV